MAPLPKRKYAKTRQRLRRQHLRQRRATVVVCGTCQSPTVAHRVCYVCGTYRGREVVRIEEAGEE